jgi:hypothetical protein
MPKANLPRFPPPGLIWDRSTGAEGEGDVREARHAKFAPDALDKCPLIDGCLPPFV